MDTDGDDYPDSVDCVINFSENDRKMFTLVGNLYYLVLIGEELGQLGLTENDLPGDLSYALDQSSIDKGISIDSGGMISWKPETTGTHMIAVTVTSDALTINKVVALTVESPGFEFEVNNLPENANSIQSFNSLWGNIGTQDDIDYFLFQPPNPGMYRVQFLPDTGNTADTKMEIQDENGNLLGTATSINDGVVNIDAGLTQGAHYIILQCPDGFSSTYHYGLKLWPVADYVSPQTVDAAQMAIEYTGNLINLYDKDTYTVNMPHSLILQIDFDSNNFSAKPYIQITGPADYQNFFEPTTTFQTKIILPTGRATDISRDN